MYAPAREPRTIISNFIGFGFDSLPALHGRKSGSGGNGERKFNDRFHKVAETAPKLLTTDCADNADKGKAGRCLTAKLTSQVHRIDAPKGGTASRNVVTKHAKGENLNREWARINANF